VDALSNVHTLVESIQKVLNIHKLLLVNNFVKVHIDK